MAVLVLPPIGRPMRIAAAVSATLLLAAGAARADDVSELRERLEAQEQKIRVLERKLELQDEAAKAAVPNTPVVRASPQQGFRIQSADGANVVRLRGVLQFDGRYFPDDVTPETSDTWILRRVRPILEGTLNGIYDFRFTPDFAGGRAIVQDAYIAARLKPWAVVTAGKFKPPVGLERLQSATDLRFVERGFPTNLVPNRDVGFQVSGEMRSGMFSYAAGVFNGVTDLGFGDVDASDAKELAARVFTVPFVRRGRGAPLDLGVGFAGSIGNERGTPAAPATS